MNVIPKNENDRGENGFECLFVKEGARNENSEPPLQGSLPLQFIDSGASLHRTSIKTGFSSVKIKEICHVQTVDKSTVQIAGRRSVSLFVAGENQFKKCVLKKYVVRPFFLLLFAFSCNAAR